MAKEKAKLISEHDALQKIDSLTEPLTEEERLRVFNFIISKYKINLSGINTQGGAGGGSPGGFGDGAHGQHKNIKDFVVEKKPEGFYEKIACVGYYLEKYGNLDGFKTSDIVKGFTESKQTKLPHSSAYVDNAATKYGFLISSGKGRRSLSARGEAVVNALPDRGKVTQALADHPFKRNRKKRAKP